MLPCVVFARTHPLRGACLCTRCCFMQAVTTGECKPRQAVVCCHCADFMAQYGTKFVERGVCASVFVKEQLLADSKREGALAGASMRPRNFARSLGRAARWSQKHLVTESRHTLCTRRCQVSVPEEMRCTECYCLAHGGFSSDILLFL